MMIKIVLTTIAVLLTLPARAGCWSVEDDPGSAPQRAVICVTGKCRTATVQSYCANSLFAAASYSNGLIIHREEGNDAITINDKLVRWRSVTCKAVDEGACYLFEFEPATH